MRKFVVTVSGVAAVSLAVAALAFAAESYTVSASMTAKADVPAPKGAANAKGGFTGTYTENTSGAVLKWKLTFSALTGKAMAAHIHRGKRGVAGAVIVSLCGPCKNGQSGTVTISKAAIKSLEAGAAYVNVHTAKNQAGEIRGQVKVAG